MFVSDLQYYVSGKLKCRVFYSDDVTIFTSMGDRKLLAYGKGIFHDYSSGINFEDLKRYDFVWNAGICFLEPGFSQELTIVIFKKD